MSENEIPAAADKIYELIQLDKLDGSENDLQLLIGIYQRFGINTPERIAAVNEAIVQRQLEALKGVGLAPNLEFKVRTTRVKHR